MVSDLLVNMGTFGVILLVYVTIVFCIAQWQRDNSVMDIAYGPAFFMSALGTLWWTGTVLFLPLLITGGLALWSTRLALRIYRKNHGKPEDARYAAWRTAWTQRGQLYFVTRSYIQINLLQGIIIWLVALPFIIALTSPTLISLPFLLAGIVVYAIGLGYESIADYQLDQFLSRKRAGTEPALLMTTGLFRFSRRPNYFGETLVWWGLAIMVLPLPFGYCALISPLLITYIVTKVTGPMLEALFLQKYPAEYRAYMNTTNYFIPGPSRTTPLMSSSQPN